MMSILKLPKSTVFGRVVPKNAFDEYTNSKQKKLIADTIQRISWTNKLSQETTNLSGTAVKEIQVFQIDLKQKNDLKKILDIFDRSIPYHIIFILLFDDELMISTSAKHDHVTKANEAIIDCTFRTDWMSSTDHNINVKLQESLDQTFIRFCSQLSQREKEYLSYAEFVESEMRIQDLEIKISKVESQIRREKQFNRKVQFNLELDELKAVLEDML